MTLKDLGELLMQAPQCGKCGAHMALRMRREDKELFWGCTRFPGCYGSLPFTSNCVWNEIVERTAQRLRGVPQAFF